MGRTTEEKSKGVRPIDPLASLEPTLTDKEVEESLDYVLAGKGQVHQRAALKTLLEIAYRRGVNRTFVFLAEQAQQGQDRFDEDKF